MRVLRTQLVAASACGALGAVCRDVIIRLVDGERVSYYSAHRREWGEARLVIDPCRPRNIDGTDMSGPGPMRIALGDDVLAASGGGFWVGDYAVFTEHATGYPFALYKLLADPLIDSPSR